MIDYQIIRAESPEALQAAVLVFIGANPGYLPAGGPVFFHEWLQALYK